MIKPTTIGGLLLAALLLANPVLANEEAACEAAVSATRVEAAALPPGDPSRRFAEHSLDMALVEMSAGEVEECPDLVEEARIVIVERPYVLRPGETLNGYGPDSPR